MLLQPLSKCLCTKRTTFNLCLSTPFNVTGITLMNADGVYITLLVETDEIFAQNVPASLGSLTPGSATLGPCYAAPIAGPHFTGCFNDYHVTPSDVRVPQQDPDSWENKSWPMRDFPTGHVFRADNSVAKCAIQAKAAGSAYFGLSKSIECWCVDKT